MFRKFHLVALTVAIGVLLPCTQAGASLLLGGDFDDATDFSNNWTTGGSGTPQISGDAFNLAPQAGDGYLAFTGNSSSGANGFAYQDVNGLVIGQTYRLEFYYGVRGGNTNGKVSVSSNGSDLVTEEFNAAAVGVWEMETIDFQATSSTVRIQFQETSTNSKSTGPAIDSASMRAVPEATAFVVWTVLGSVGIVARRRIR